MRCREARSSQWRNKSICWRRNFQSYAHSTRYRVENNTVKTDLPSSPAIDVQSRGNYKPKEPVIIELEKEEELKLNKATNDMIKSLTSTFLKEQQTLKLQISSLI